MTSTRLAVATVALALSACATPVKLATSWLNPDYTPGTKFQKLAVIAVTKDPANRQAVEDAMAEIVSSAHQSYKFTTPEELADGGKVAERLKAEGFDGLVVMSVIGFDTATQPQEAAGNTASRVQYTPQTATTEQLRVETQIFSLTDDKLFWSGITTGFDATSIQKTVKEIVNVVVDDLKRRQVL
jgi:hypothetical protein